MKRRINNLHKGMLKGNKTSNIIELHSKKRQPEKSKEDQNINISQYKYSNNNEDINKNKNKSISKNKQHKKNISPSKKEKVSNIYNDTFSDSDSSHNKSIIKTKLYNKYAKSGTYFKRLRQQVIDKFISGKPLISIERMYNNPEVKKMFGVQNNSEKTNYQSNNSYKNYEECISSKKKERDRRIPPSKFIPMPNIYNNNMNIKYTNEFNNNFSNINNINNINDNEESNRNNYIKSINTMNKNNPYYYYHNIQNPNNLNIFQNNNNQFIPFLYNQKQKYDNNINNMSFISSNENNEINNGGEKDIFEYDTLQDIKKEFRKKRISNEENREKYMIQLSGINEEINNEYNNDYYKNENREYNEVEDINNLLNNLKNANNNNYYNEYNIFPQSNRENDSYFSSLLVKKDREKNFVNYFKNNKRIIETSETNNDIIYDTPSKQ